MYNKCISQLLLQGYFKLRWRSSTDEGDREDEGAWRHKVALTRRLHICTKSSAKLFRIEAKLQ